MYWCSMPEEWRYYDGWLLRIYYDEIGFISVPLHEQHQTPMVVTMQICGQTQRWRTTDEIRLNDASQQDNVYTSRSVTVDTDSKALGLFRLTGQWTRSIEKTSSIVFQYHACYTSRFWLVWLGDRLCWRHYSQNAEPPNVLCISSLAA